ncbi:MAG: glycoside hydrolase family 140 protein [Acidobacteria bacterium]|nr:glycoside hydrolase family 140 protein [Acidobacteriota bacterium]
MRIIRVVWSFIALAPLLLLIVPLVGQPLGAERPTLPLKISTNRRHLVDQKDRPFLIHGDTAWSLISGLTKEEAKRYLENRRKKGFNSIIVNLIEHKFRGPVNREGEAPFTTPGDFNTPNEKYFAHADWVLQKAAEKDFVVFLFPMYLGAKGSDEGWYQEVILNGVAKCRQYGCFVGRRYKDFSNLVWGMGGDRNPDLAKEATDAVAAGIRESAPDHLFTAHAAPESSAFDEYSSSGLYLNGTYSYHIVPWLLFRDYNRRPVAPFFLFESIYEADARYNPSPVQIRRQAYWTSLCGGAGQFFGNWTVWPFDPGWEIALDAEGSRSMAHLSSLFQSRPWHELVPDQAHKVVIDGVGAFRSLDYLAAARTSDRRILIAYVPTPRTFTIDMSQIAGNQARVWWFDPRSGKVKEGETVVTQGRQKFSPPGDGDWVLVIEDVALNLPLP